LACIYIFILRNEYHCYRLYKKIIHFQEISNIEVEKFICSEVKQCNQKLHFHSRMHYRVKNPSKYCLYP